MVKKEKEQLEEVVNVEESVEDVTSTTEKEESEAIVVVEDLDVETEKLSLQIDRTKEELAVISEVREELVKLYSDYKEVEQLKSKAQSENEILQSDVKIMSEELNAYKIAEERVKAEKYVNRLEQLSAKFGALGQEKTVVYLNSKDETTIREFETIVDAALSKFGEVAEMPPVTLSTQSESLSASAEPSEPTKKQEPVAAKVDEQISDKNFFASVCGQLTNEQVGQGKKVKFM